MGLRNRSSDEIPCMSREKKAVVLDLIFFVVMGVLDPNDFNMFQKRNV